MSDFVCSFLYIKPRTLLALNNHLLQPRTQWFPPTHKSAITSTRSQKYYCHHSFFMFLPQPRKIGAHNFIASHWEEWVCTHTAFVTQKVVKTRCHFSFRHSSVTSHKMRILHNNIWPDDGSSCSERDRSRSMAGGIPCEHMMHCGSNNCLESRIQSWNAHYTHKIKIIINQETGWK